ncbi:MAG: DUF2520 domain-containing protein [Tannerella sp.]|jgi:predicted short-subunit dehydrogenase-like oxidoreductase (DUF2520 family)|nr:DUF2520 domain-containing protein [Tannerella sp.]
MNTPDIKKNILKVIFIGAGNVAARMSLSMKDAGFSILQVFSRTEENARMLGKQLTCDFITETSQIRTDADIYIFSIKDDILPNIIAEIPVNNGIWAHTAGSVPIDVFEGYAERYGVIYPLQTLSKNRYTDFRKIPLFVEGNAEASEKEIRIIAEKISENVYLMTSEKRRYLHLAAVFACNFSNHMYRIATQILEEQDIDRQVLQPLIDETANKLYTMSPDKAQTGPAIRYDRNIINRHLALLKDPDIRNIYESISKNIHEKTGTAGYPPPITAP